MMAFRQFNIQLLPLDSKKTNDVGVDGYQKLFELLGAEVSAAHKARTLDDTAFELPNDTRFTPFYVHFEKEYAHGSFIRYHRANTVSDLYTARPLFQASPRTAPVSNSYQLPYVFAYDNHRLAIDEQGGKLPASPRMLEALRHFLSGIAEKHFPAYTLQLNLVAEKKALATALAEARGFRKVEVSLTFQNGPRFDAQLDEMREKNVHHVDINASPERGALMTSLPDWLKEFVEASTQFGKAFLSYVKQDGKSAHFKTDNFPEKFSVRKQKKELWANYLNRIYYKVAKKTAPKKTTEKKVVAKKVVAKKAP